MVGPADNHASPARKSAAEQAADQAADWFARLSGDNVSDADCAEYRQWRQSSAENANAYDRVAATWANLGSYADESSILEMRVGALAERPDAQSKSRRTGQIAAIAASIALVFAATAVFVSGGLSLGGDTGAGAGPQVAANGAASPQAGVLSQTASDTGPPQEALEFRSGYSTKIGQMADFTLPDGSVIQLNTGSEVQVDYSAGQRNLTLVKGEAVFTVAKDAGRPFTVAAGDSRVVALGTIFSVRKSDRQADVTLIEGRVRVDREGQTAGDKSAHLLPGEHLSVVPSEPFAISRTQISRVASWRDGRLVFENTPLSEVLAEFNRYSIEKHVLGDESLSDLLVSGTFRIKSGEHFSATLEAGFPVVVRARSGGSVLEVRAAQDSALPSSDYDN